MFWKSNLLPRGEFIIPETSDCRQFWIPVQPTAKADVLHSIGDDFMVVWNLTRNDCQYCVSGAISF